MYDLGYIFIPWSMASCLIKSNFIICEHNKYDIFIYLESIIGKILFEFYRERFVSSINIHILFLILSMSCLNYHFDFMVTELITFASQTCN